MNIYAESIIRLETYHYKVRIWRHEPTCAISDINELKTKALAILNREPITAIAARDVLALDDVNAVEVIPHALSVGIVLYKDWP